jgi:coenzyme F420 hydrogenase subunit beta
VDFLELNKYVFGEQPENSLLGNAVSYYVGHSTDEEIRRRASSGGIVPSLLHHLLETGVIDGVLLTRMSAKDPLEPEAIIARNTEEVIAASGSKYCPVNLAKGIRHILNHDGKYAVVGLPCHIEGLRKAEMVSRKLSDRIVLHIGLFCNHTVGFHGTEFLLKRMNVEKTQVAKLTYRARGWPGGMLVSLKDGSQKFLPEVLYWNLFFNHLFIHRRCTLCFDQTNELADISLGDAWLPRFKKGGGGESVVICRTKFADELFQEVMRAQAIEGSEIDENEVIQSQQVTLRYKKGLFRARASVVKLFGGEVPRVKARFLRAGFMSYVAAMLTYVTTSWSSGAVFLRMLSDTPIAVLKGYNTIVDLVSNA